MRRWHEEGDPRELGFPKPETDAELEVVSERYFGTPLHLRELAVHGSGAGGSGRYEVAEDFDSYDPFNRDFDAHGRFWDWVLGPLYCGGTARASYGQFRCGHRQRRRLERWVCSRRSGDSSSVRPAFDEVSQAAQGPGENTPNRADRGVLRSGRVDGASSSFAEGESA